MSVINEMLRNLDSRQAPGSSPDKTEKSPTDIARDTLIVSDPVRVGRRRGSLVVVVLMATAVALLGVSAGGWWYRTQHQLPQRTVDQITPAARSASSSPVIMAAPAGTAPAQQKALESIAVNASAAARRAPDYVWQKTLAGTSPVATKLPLLQSDPVRKGISLKIDNAFKRVTIPTAVFKPLAVGNLQPLQKHPLLPSLPMSMTPVMAGAIAVPPAPARQSPALEALAQAQSLWSADSREPAIDLLREALAAVERTDRAGLRSDNRAVLALLARELARMEMAQGRVNQALELLTRLQPALSGVADVWAIRGSAAQRLGRHQESAAAYLMALKLRPDEPRWMLGAAVSLAAQGKTAAAAELAEKARDGGALSQELAVYLRQLGVPLRER